MYFLSVKETRHLATFILRPAVAHTYLLRLIKILEQNLKEMASIKRRQVKMRSTTLDQQLLFSLPNNENHLYVSQL